MASTTTCKQKQAALPNIGPLPKFSRLSYDRPKHVQGVSLPVGTDVRNALEMFSLFITPSHFKEMAKNTNAYAASKRTEERRRRQWFDTCEEEMQVYVGIMIYMGIVVCPVIPDYWRQNLNENTIHLVCSYMALDRFENLRQYFHVSAIEEQPQNRPRDKKEWWSKVEPLASNFLDASQEYLIPATNISIDEIMIQFSGRSLHTYKMPNKPISQGYKMFSLCNKGYCYNFMWSSRTHSIGNPTTIPRLTNTSSIVYQLAKSLPYENYQFALYLDNYFTNVPLFKVLRNLGIGACGTTCRHPLFSLKLIKLKKSTPKLCPGIL